VLALKTRDEIPARLARLLASAQRRAPLDNASLIVPVPLHTSRQRERGFNQAAVVGQALARLNGLPLDTSSLARAVHTERHRARMDAHSRRESVENAFEVRRPRLIQGENVLLVDDVFTTGATVSACARALKEAGAIEVFVLTLARPSSKLS
jgi:ComF family protein